MFKNKVLPASWSSANIRLWSGKLEVGISGRSNLTQCCQWIATATTFHNKLCCPGAMMRRRGPTNSLHASIIKDFDNRRLGKFLFCHPSTKYDRILLICLSSFRLIFFRGNCLTSLLLYTHVKMQNTVF